MDLRTGCYTYARNLCMLHACRRLRTPLLPTSSNGEWGDSFPWCAQAAFQCRQETLFYYYFIFKLQVVSNSIRPNHHHTSGVPWNENSPATGHIWYQSTFLKSLFWEGQGNKGREITWLPRITDFSTHGQNWQASYKKHPTCTESKYHQIRREKQCVTGTRHEVEQHTDWYRKFSKSQAL